MIRRFRAGAAPATFLIGQPSARTPSRRAVQLARRVNGLITGLSVSLYAVSVSAAVLSRAARYSAESREKTHFFLFFLFLFPNTAHSAPPYPCDPATLTVLIRTPTEPKRTSRGSARKPERRTTRITRRITGHDRVKVPRHTCRRRNLPLLSFAPSDSPRIVSSGSLPILLCFYYACDTHHCYFSLH